MLHRGGEPPPWKLPPRQPLPQTLTLTICEQLFLLWYSTRLFSDAERDPLDIAKFLVYMRTDIQQAVNADATLHVPSLSDVGLGTLSTLFGDVLAASCS